MVFLVMAVPGKRPTVGGTARERVWSVLLREEPGSVRDGLITLGPEAIEPVLEILSGSAPELGRDPAASRAASAHRDDLYHALAAWPMDRVVEGAVRKARAASFPEQLTAIEILGRVGDAGALERVLDILTGTDPLHLGRTLVQKQLEQSIGAMVARDAGCAQVISRRQRDLPGRLKPILARSLGRCLRQDGVRALEQMLRQSSELDGVVLEQLSRLDVRDVAAFHGETVGIARGYLNSSESNLRRQATLSLGLLHDEESFESLIAVLDDPQPSVSAAALHALRSMSGLSWEAQPGRWSEWLDRQDAWLAAELPQLERAASSGRPEAAVEALRAVSHHPLFRKRAARALSGGLRHPDPGVVAFACSVLANMKSAFALPGLIEALRHPDEGVRAAARAALRSITGVESSTDYGTWKAWLDA